VELIAASREAIDMAEDRELFKNAMKEIGSSAARRGGAFAGAGHEIQQTVGFPCVIRPSFTMGGSGGGIAYNRESSSRSSSAASMHRPTSEVLIEESVIGWKEFEMEVVRDRTTTASSCARSRISIRWACTPATRSPSRPAQTLTDKEYQRMRNASIAVLRKIGVDTGGSNVQFAVSPKDGRLLVIEMNPRVSRSSALASKATGLPDRQDRRQARRRLHPR
jgi:carbamoyl-phosphate synthase large subunit